MNSFDHKEYSLPLLSKQMADYIADYKDTFPEWYMPLELGQHKIPARTYPSFKNRPESLLDDTLGKRKWDLIIKDNLPNLNGKVVCDVGCNIGIFSLEMARMGAKKVVGYDRGIDIVQPNNPHLGSQSVAQQAYFVRNLYEAWHNLRFGNVEFYDVDLMKLDFTKLKCDLFFACCVLYHLGAERMEEIIRQVSEHTPEVFLQANNGHGGELGRLSCLEHHVSLLKKYGYSIKTIDSPPGYAHPVVLGEKTICR